MRRMFTDDFSSDASRGFQGNGALHAKSGLVFPGSQLRETRSSGGIAIVASDPSSHIVRAVGGGCGCRRAWIRSRGEVRAGGLLEKVLDAVGVSLVFRDRPEDVAVRPLAKRGFFDFWNKISPGLGGEADLFTASSGFSKACGPS